MNRDESTENAGVDKSIMLPNSADVEFGKRMSITRAAKRFERYGHVEDGQSLVSLIGDIAGSLEGRETHVVSPRHKRKAREDAERGVEEAARAAEKAARTAEETQE